MQISMSNAHQKRYNVKIAKKMIRKFVQGSNRLTHWPRPCPPCSLAGLGSSWNHSRRSGTRDAWIIRLSLLPLCFYTIMPLPYPLRLLLRGPNGVVGSGNLSSSTLDTLPSSVFPSYSLINSDPKCRAMCVATAKPGRSTHVVTGVQVYKSRWHLLRAYPLPLNDRHFLPQNMHSLS